jgi:hypothetical protein
VAPYNCVPPRLPKYVAASATALASVQKLQLRPLDPRMVWYGDAPRSYGATYLDVVLGRNERLGRLREKCRSRNFRLGASSPGLVRRVQRTFIHMPAEPPLMKSVETSLRAPRNTADGFDFEFDPCPIKLGARYSCER